MSPIWTPCPICQQPLSATDHDTGTWFLTGAYSVRVCPICPLDPVLWNADDGLVLRVSDFFQPTLRPRMPTMDEARRLGVLTVPQQERAQSSVDDDAISGRKRDYDRYSKEELIEELSRRDMHLLHEGRALADQRTFGRMLREFARATISLADHADLRRIEGDPSKTATIERLLLALGAPPTDARMLKHEGGHGLGMGYAGAAAEEQQIQSPLVPTQPRPDVADRIREFERDHKVKPVGKADHDRD